MKNRIQELRKAQHMTQADLADQLDVTRQTIISLEKGKYNASLLLAHHIATLFQLEIEEVFIFEEDKIDV
ncbi:helix-turn-helix transcriptional regulator [uncultured Leuconostoc sp.]|uniref:helix-turn-helix transcriptional regulator n=1 Tax=uncultured Leuconostoc sp. TaxID=173262 RepID=UPI0025F6BECC|nr:helix-turn-helix transcriptional regulator [uncultured Leuconostoc sp.]